MACKWTDLGGAREFQGFLSVLRDRWFSVDMAALSGENSLHHPAPSPPCVMLRNEERRHLMGLLIHSAGYMHCGRSVSASRGIVAAVFTHANTVLAR